eukprot:358807-Pyramimonas_sp.AAC.1
MNNSESRFMNARVPLAGSWASFSSSTLQRLGGARCAAPRPAPEGLPPLRLPPDVVFHAISFYFVP